MLHEQDVYKPFKNSTLSYKLGNLGTKKVTFNSDKIKVEVEHSGAFNEILPVLISEDDLISETEGQIRIETKNGSFSILSSEKGDITIKDFETDLLDKKCKMINISAQNRLSYEIHF
jgi:hypothetical protein